jgi:hypothetical protein
MLITYIAGLVLHPLYLRLEQPKYRPQNRRMS